MTIVRFVARPMLASLFVVQGIQTLRDPQPVVPKSQPVVDRLRPLLNKYAPQLPTDPRSMVRLNAGVHVVAGLAFATGRFPRLSALALASSLGPTTVAGHRFWEADDPAVAAQQRIHFLKNIALAGGLLIAAVDTEGRPGLAWRTQHAAVSARRTARTARRSTRLAARAATADARRQVADLLP